MVLRKHLRKFSVFSPLFTYSRALATAQSVNKEVGKWNSVVGLEIHAQLNVKSKLFSGASTAFGSRVNDNVALFDAAAPGTLPVLNRKCVEMGVVTALALSCQLNAVSFFDRKHYFYADLPAGYQITQQRAPLAQNGLLEFQVFAPGKRKLYAKTSRLKQLQLEQDSGKSLHDDVMNRSLIDLNRAGIPLMELVFEPDLTDGEEAAAMVKELCLIFSRLRTCSCRMAGIILRYLYTGQAILPVGEGALRVDANISVNRVGEPLGVRTEVKNLSSIRSVANAVDFEISRQVAELENGGTIENETRGWDSISSCTVSMRDKEVKMDYRFMPEPNLPPLRINLSDVPSSLVNVNALALSLPELPNQTRSRLREIYSLPVEMINNLVNEESLLELFTKILQDNEARDANTVAKLLTIELMTLVNKELTSLDSLRWNENTLGEIVDLLHNGDINLTTAKFVLLEISNNNPSSPKQIVEKHGLSQISDTSALNDLCDQIIDENPKIVSQFKSGKAKVFNALMGALAQKSDNRADMKRASQIMKEKLGKPVER